MCFNSRLKLTFSPQILWTNRLRKDREKTCKVCVDGTDFQLTSKDFPKQFFTHKFRKCGLRYEVATNIQTGDIVWTSGPHLPGVRNDIKVFREGGLKELLIAAGEKAEADDGYVGERNTIRHPAVFNSSEDYKAKKRVRARHETVNRRFKFFNCLHNTYRHDFGTHAYCFMAVVVLVQLSFENGEKPYQVHY